MKAETVPGCQKVHQSHPGGPSFPGQKDDEIGRPERR